jgi:hypothetical protein
MIKLALSAVVITILGDVALTVKPLSRAVTREARADGDKAKAEYLTAEPDDTDGANAIWQDAYVTSIAKQTITEWSGVLGDDGNPAPVTPDAITALMSLDAPYAAFIDNVVNPYMDAQSEKNGSSNSSDGSTSTGDMNTAAPVQN